MDIVVHTHHLAISPERLDFIKRRTALALGRFSEKIRSVTLRLVDTNGPKGGTDIDGSAEITLMSGGHLVVHSCDTSPESTVFWMLDRARSAIVRYAGRQRARSRRLLVQVTRSWNRAPETDNL